MPKITWQDVYSSRKTTLERVKENLGEWGISETWGEIVYKDKEWIILRQHRVTPSDEFVDSDDFFVIPRSLIRKWR